MENYHNIYEASIISMIVLSYAYQQPFSTEISSNFSLFMYPVAYLFSLKYLKAIVGEDRGPWPTGI